MERLNRGHGCTSAEVRARNQRDLRREQRREELLPVQRARRRGAADRCDRHGDAGIRVRRIRQRAEPQRKRHEPLALLRGVLRRGDRHDLPARPVLRSEHRQVYQCGCRVADYGGAQQRY